jgi:phosphomannomutase
MEKAAGGIILTASHNPKQWNALKLLNEKGEFLNALEGENVLKIAAEESFIFSPVDELGKLTEDNTYTQKHIESVLALELVDVKAIKDAGFKVAIDCVNSVGGIVIPALLKALGVTQVEKLYCEPNGQFPHNPEPLPEHLTEISSLMKNVKADVGFVVDPDVDRLAIICEDGSMFGEEYTLVSISDYVLQHTPGNTVSNLSSTRALRDVTAKYDCKYTAAAVGEVNVVTTMKTTHAIIGGEGNGGVIYPASHYGRDALVGIALFLTQLAKSKLTVSALRKTYPEYYISKNKIQLTPSIHVDDILKVIKESYKQYEVNDIDGVKIDFPTGWVHLRKSNTEPIIRIYSEAKTIEQAEGFANAIIDEIKRIAKI